MKYLLDVNAVLALLVEAHVHHPAARRWNRTLGGSDELCLTPWVEIGFLRVGLQTRLIPDVAAGHKMLESLAKGKPAVTLLVDSSRAADLPGWAITPGRLGDGHLTALAAAHGALLATFDRDIPGALQIPPVAARDR